MDAYYAELAQRFPEGFDPGPYDIEDPAEVAPPNGQFLVLRSTDDGSYLGCGAVRALEPGLGEIKRMWLHQSMRGQGLGLALLQELERWSVELGLSKVRLDTNSTLANAIALYKANGYREIPCYNDNPYAQHWFEKDLT